MYNKAFSTIFLQFCCLALHANYLISIGILQSEKISQTTNSCLIFFSESIPGPSDEGFIRDNDNLVICFIT